MKILSPSDPVEIPQSHVGGTGLVALFRAIFLAMTFAAALLLASGLKAQTYAFTNFAGMPGGVGNVDGIGSAARFNQPGAVAVDSAGNVYVADTQNHTI